MRARSSALDGGIHLVERAPLATDPTSTMRRTPHDGHAATAVLGAILVLSTVLRFGRLGHNSLWFDEAYTALLTQHTWHHILEVLRTKDTHPPLYFFMMKGWAGLTGISEVALRIPSAAFAVLSVGLTYALVRRLASEPVSLLGVFLVAISPIQIMIGQEAKMYTLLGVL